MKNFWMIFNVTAVVGSVGIYIAAPMAGPHVMAFFRMEAPPVAEPLLEAVSAGGTDEPPAPVRSPADAPAASDERDSSPSLLEIYPARSNEQPGWGVTSHKIPYYKADGSNAGMVEGGVLFDCGKMSTSSKGVVIECRFLQEGMPGGTFFIGRKDAQFFTSTHQKLSKSRLQALKSYYALNGKIEARRAEILEQGANQNPYFASARAAHEAYQKHIQDAQQLEQMRDKLEGTKRMDLEDKLRAMKMNEGALTKTFKETQDKFTEWKKAHADSVPKPEDDTNIQEWTREKKRLAAALPGLAY